MIYKVFISRLYIIAVFLCCGCNSSDSKKTITVTQDKPEFFYPVTSFISEQIVELDSVPVTPLLTITVKDKSDSTWITKEEAKKWLQQFLTPQIDTLNMTGYFKETRFVDQTINAITFMYEPKIALPDSFSLRSWDIYIDPQTGKIKKLYLVKQRRQSDSLITEQLTWQTGKWARVNSILNNPGGNSVLLKEEKIDWSLTDF